MVVVAGGDRGDGGVEISDDGPLQVLRLHSFAGPAASRGAVVAEGAAHSVIGAGALQQRVNLLGRGLRATEPQLEHTAHRRRQVLVFQLALDRLAVKLRHSAALLLQPGQQTRDLIDAGDGAVRELSELGVDLAVLPLARSAAPLQRTDYRHRNRAR